jgi:MscS family membrane protein
MNLVRAHLLICILGLFVFTYAAAQTLPGLSPEPKAGQEIPADLLGRQTPSGCFFGFLKAVRLGKYQTAAQYLQLSPSQRRTQGEQLSIKLESVLNHGLVGGAPEVSTRTEGTAQEGVPLDRERIGRVSVNGMKADVDLIRFSDPDVGMIWLFSADTLAKVPDLYDRLQKQEEGAKPPATLLGKEFLDVPVSKWLELLVTIPAAAVLAWFLIMLFVLPVRLWRRFLRHTAIKSWIRISGPVWLIIGVCFNAVLFQFISFPILYRHYYFVLLKIGYAIGTAWLLLRILTRIMNSLRNRAIARGRPEMDSLMLIGQRLLKILVVVFCGLAVLRALGLDMTAALAGLGIGGLAISFGAQKTIENLFGGVSVMGDDVIRVGDFCQIGDRVGTVEDISLRSTRIRTLERTELSVPNGSLATINVENFSRRDKMLFNPVLGLRYETTCDQMRYLLAETRSLLYRHPKVETDTARVRFSGFGDSALSVEIFSFVRTCDYAEFTAIREDLLLRIMDIVTEAGTGFAFPSHTVYLGKDSGLDRERTDAAVQKTRQWREEKQLPFPDFPPTEIEEMRDSLSYPPPDSAFESSDTEKK